MERPLYTHFQLAIISSLTNAGMNISRGEIANSNKRLNRECLAWNEMRAGAFFDIKAGGVGLSRKPGDQTKNFFSNRQRVNNVSFPTFDFF